MVGFNYLYASPKESFENKYKIDRENGKLVFLSAGGAVLKEYSLDKKIDSKQAASLVNFSENGNFVCVSSTVQTAGNSKARRDGTFVVLNDRGNELWSVTDDFHGYAEVAPNGKYVVSQKEDVLRVYYSDGKKIELKSDEGFSLAFAKDGSFLVLETVEVDSKDYKLVHEQTGLWGGVKNHNLIVMSDQGDILWRKNGFIHEDKFVVSLKILENKRVQVEVSGIKEKEKYFLMYDYLGNPIN